MDTPDNAPLPSDPFLYQPRFDCRSGELLTAVMTTLSLRWGRTR